MNEYCMNNCSYIRNNHSNNMFQLYHTVTSAPPLVMFIHELVHKQILQTMQIFCISITLKHVFIIFRGFNKLLMYYINFLVLVCLMRITLAPPNIGLEGDIFIKSPLKINESIRVRKVN